MAVRRKQRRRRVTARNPLVPVVRAVRPKVRPSVKAYTRKPKHKHKRPPDEDGGGNR